jgi:hypothetical protein
VGLLTKIFGGPDGGANAGEPASATTATASPAGEAALPALPAYTKGDNGNSGIRPAIADRAITQKAITERAIADRGHVDRAHVDRAHADRQLEAPAQRAREATRPNSTNRRPEHPRMYLRATPASIDPTLPGSTRRQQISVRPSGGKLPTGSQSPNHHGSGGHAANGLDGRAPLPPSKRGLERSIDRSGIERGASRAAEEANRRERAEPTPAGMRLQRARPRPSMVVSPVSLTPEQLALPPGVRQKMPTLLGLGTAIGEVLAREPRSSQTDGLPGSGIADAGVAAGSIPDAAAVVVAVGDDSEISAADAAASLPAAAAVVSDAEDPGAIGVAVARLADFALELSIGPLSSAWADEVRRAVHTLASVAKQRQQASLAAVLARLLELLPDAAPSSPIVGALREQLVHELTRLAGLLPEWPAPAQDLAEEARRREVRIVRELLLAVDGTRRDQRARLEQQVRLEALGSMTGESLAQELAAPVERGRELRRVLDAYFSERQTSEPDFERRLGLRRAIDRLETAARAFDDADPEQKAMQRTLRAARRDAMSAVNILLAERGEHEWLDVLEPLSIGERIERLRHWFGSTLQRTGVDGAGVEGPSWE